MKRSLVITLFFSLPFGLLAPRAATAQGPGKDLPDYLARSPFPMPAVTVPQFPQHIFTITDYGALGDGQTLNTTAFEKAIHACAAAGGGIVEVPPGLWLTGPIRFESHINLHVERGALVLFTKDHTQYPMVPASGNSSNFVTASPLYGYDLKDIAITGEGIIDGGGDSWRPVKKEKTTASQWKQWLASGGMVEEKTNIWWPSQEALDGGTYLKQLKKKNPKPDSADYLPARDFLRPCMVYFVNCENLLLEGITLRNSPKFVFYPNHCTNITLRQVNIFNEWWAQNGDGIDISACKNVIIYRCNVSAGDDGICMKSSGGKKDEPGIFNLENVLIAACNVYHAHGGFVIGSNTDGGMRNIFVTDCNFIGTDVGVRVKSNAGRGGLVKDIYVRNIYMRDMANEALLFDTYYENKEPGLGKNGPAAPREKIPEFCDFYFSDIYCNGAKTAVAMTGLAGMPVHDIHFDTVVISSQNSFLATEASHIDLRQVRLLNQKGPVYLLKNTTGFHIRGGYLPPGQKIFVAAEGKTDNVTITGTDLPGEAGAILLGSEVDKNAVTIQ